MRLRVITILAVGALCLAPTAGWADLAPYSQDFEGLTPAPQPEDPFESSLADDGWLFFGLVFFSNGQVDFGYGPFPAPNHGEAISAVVGGQGGPAQGAQQLSVFSDYRNTRHGAGQLVETNVFQEQRIGAADVGTTWRFEFDAKRGNIGGATSAKAFFKTIHPTQFWLSRFIWIDLTDIPATWDSYSLSIFIAPDIEGHIFQFGFLNAATFYEGSGLFYDNVNFLRDVSLDVKPGSCPNLVDTRSKGVLPVALLGTGDLDVNDIDVASLQLEGVAPIRSSYEDVAAPFPGDLCGCTEAGPDGSLDLTLKFATQEVIDAIGPSPSGDRVLSLTGTLLDGTPFKGDDCIVIVGGGD